jgi:hyperosmotically inducible protein
MDATDLESKQYKSNLLTYTVDEGSLLNMNKVFALVILLVCLFSGCETIRQKTSGPEFEDAKLTAIIKAELAREDTASVQAISVKVDNSVATLKGTVNSAEKKAKAEEITGKVSGVKSVVNNLEVKL